MKNSLMQWHLARDNQLKLARFCEKHKISSTFDAIDVDSPVFTIKYNFDNDSYIVAEMYKGNKERGYTIADHFQVVDYKWGNA